VTFSGAVIRSGDWRRRGQWGSRPVDCANIRDQAVDDRPSSGLGALEWDDHGGGADASQVHKAKRPTLGEEGHTSPREDHVCSQRSGTWAMEHHVR